MRIVFLGTPDFAVPSLQMLIDKGYQIVGVFSQPDKPVGRKQILQSPPVKQLALSHGIPVFQPKKIRLPDGLEVLQKLQPDLMITAAFGQILSADNLAVPKYGCINVHGSLLPKYRGAAPIQWAVINGETETGVTTMLTDIGVDTGDMLVQKKLSIGADETAGELFHRVSVLGAATLHETIQQFENGTMVRVPQDHTAATHCKMLSKENGLIDWRNSAQQIHNLVRGVNPWPGAYTFINEEKIKIWRTRVTGSDAPYKKPGMIVQADPKDGLFVATGQDVVEVLEIQAQGGKRLEAGAFLRGNRLREGEIFSLS